MAVTKTAPTTLYLGAEVVFASTDRGATWKTISPDLTGKVAGAPGCDGDPNVSNARACGYGGIWSLTASPRHPGELWVGTDSGLVQLTRDNGATWADITPPGLPAWAKIASIDVSALEDGVAYIAVDNQRQGDRSPRAYATHDFGKTWKSITGDLPPGHFVSVVRADTARPGLLWAGTDVGVFASWDDGARWREIQGALPTAWIRDLLVKGDDLVAATQGRAIWVLDDLALLRQIDRATPREPMHLFQPADAVRVRPNANHDTPISPEEPVGENPPDGAAIDYVLAQPAKTPVTIDIRDASGALVQTLSSERAKPPLAERYFSKAWLRPRQPLETSAGLHQARWNLRWTRPLTITSDFSIATVYGRGVAVTPEGALASPGVYTVTLKVDGRSQATHLSLARDPRAPVDPGALTASLALSKEIGDALALARRGYGEMAVARAQALGSSASSDTGIASDLAAFAARAQPPEHGDGFREEAAILSAIETDLESADLAPTAPQRQAVAAAHGRITALWGDWSAARDGAMAKINPALIRDHLKPIAFPAENDLEISLPQGGEDFP